MQRVLLLDDLGEKFGAVHQYHNLRTPVDAIRLLSINYPEFAKHLIQSGENGIGYRVVQAETDLSLEDMTLPFGSRDLIITPVITGSGRGAGMIIAGIALVGLAILMPSSVVAWKGTGFAAGVGKGLTAAAIATGGNVGIALALGGISQMLSPQAEAAPRFGTASQTMDNGPTSITRGSDGKQSYAFTGPANSVGVGQTIPVVYGKALIGSHIISADIEVTDTSDPVKNYIETPGVKTMTVAGEELDNTLQETNGIKSRLWTQAWGGVDYMDGPIKYDIKLNKVGRTHLGNVTGEFDENYPAHKFQMFFELPSGLSSNVSGTSSTKIDGYIQYRITVDNLDGYGRVGNIPITVQGLLNDTQSYKWMVQMQYGKIAEKDNYGVYIEILNYRATLPTNILRVHDMGYNFHIRP